MFLDRVWSSSVSELAGNCLNFTASLKMAAVLVTEFVHHDGMYARNTVFRKLSDLK
jgi:hypothetical protein